MCRAERCFCVQGSWRSNYKVPCMGLKLSRLPEAQRAL